MRKWSRLRARAQALTQQRPTKTSIAKLNTKHSRRIRNSLILTFSLPHSILFLCLLRCLTLEVVAVWHFYVRSPRFKLMAWLILVNVLASLITAESVSILFFSFAFWNEALVSKWFYCEFSFAFDDRALILLLCVCARATIWLLPMSHKQQRTNECILIMFSHRNCKLAAVESHIAHEIEK